jgi:hypothetical protein
VRLSLYRSRCSHWILPGYWSPLLPSTSISLLPTHTLQQPPTVWSSSGTRGPCPFRDSPDKGPTHPLSLSGWAQGSRLALADFLPQHLFGASLFPHENDSSPARMVGLSRVRGVLVEGSGKPLLGDDGSGAQRSLTWGLCSFPHWMKTLWIPEGQLTRPKETNPGSPVPTLLRLPCAHPAQPPLPA